MGQCSHLRVRSTGCILLYPLAHISTASKPMPPQLVQNSHAQPCTAIIPCSVCTFCPQPRYLEVPEVCCRRNWWSVPACCRYCATRPRAVQQRAAAAMATKPNVLVLASADSPELKVLDKVKDEVNIVGIGTTLAQLQSMPEGAWATVDVALAAGAPSFLEVPCICTHTCATTSPALCVFVALLSNSWVVCAGVGARQVKRPDLQVPFSVLCSSRPKRQRQR